VGLGDNKVCRKEAYLSAARRSAMAAAISW
jgi:hypothetical protein